jgi:hypothetical protein
MEEWSCLAFLFVHHCREAKLSGMTWTEWETWASKQRRRTSWSTVLATTPTWGEEIEYQEAMCRKGLDQMIHAYAQTRRWPKMTLEQRCFLYFRVEHAESLLKALAASPLCPPVATQFPATVEWLLIASWHVHGCFTWLEFAAYSRGVAERARLKQPPALPHRPEDGFAA